jgi:hypothetical protein
MGRFDDLAGQNKVSGFAPGKITIIRSLDIPPAS